jgi:serine/threonine-protein kinase
MPRTPGRALGALARRHPGVHTRLVRIGAYETFAELGRGGMGVVYRARSGNGRDVALKVLRHVEGEALARFERERRILADFGAEDGFVPLLDQGTANGLPYLVLPLMAGGTLRERLGRGPMATGEALALAKALARALARAHARGVVHRDMKPENVLFAAPASGGSGPATPLVADLGLAKHFDRDAPGASESVSLSKTSELRGTAGYMAPEQMTDARSVGPPADVFALGAILYECLAGQRAFVGETVFEVIAAAAAGHFERLAAVRPDVPAPVAASSPRVAPRGRGESSRGGPSSRGRRARPRSGRAW